MDNDNVSQEYITSIDNTKIKSEHLFTAYPAYQQIESIYKLIMRMNYFFGI